LKSYEVILNILQSTGPMTPIQISKVTSIPPRTVNFALRKMLKKQIVKRVPNLKDMRSPLYYLNPIEINQD